MKSLNLNQTGCWGKGHVLVRDLIWQTEPRRTPTETSERSVSARRRKTEEVDGVYERRGKRIEDPEGIIAIHQLRRV